jgi:hypothetical protein
VDPALSLIDLGLPKGIQANARTELSAIFRAGASAGIVFDLYSTGDFKFVLLDTNLDRVVIGHKAHGGWTIDASAPLVLNAGQDYKLLISLAGSTVSVMVDDRAVVGYGCNAVVVDGRFGTMTYNGAASFNEFTLKTSDSRFKDAAPQALNAPVAATTAAPADGSVTQAQLDAMVAAALTRWSQLLGGVNVSGLLQGMVFVVGDLKGAALAQTVGNVVIIDDNAAGYGWFIDATPLDDREFSGQTPSGALKAPASSAAFGRMDLLTVVMHEIGHLLGLGHDPTGSGTVMSEVLEKGTRLVAFDGSAMSSAQQHGFAIPAAIEPDAPAAPSSGPGRDKKV